MIDDGQGAPADGRLGAGADIGLTVLCLSLLELFFYTLFAVWEPVTDEPPLIMMFWPPRDSARAGLRALTSLFSPSWAGPTLRATGWGLGVCLVVVLGSLTVLIASSVSPWGG